MTGGYTNSIVMPAKAGIRHLLIILDFVSRFACTDTRRNYDTVARYP